MSFASLLDRIVIEFRNGTYFQGSNEKKGGWLGTAQRFATVEDAEAFMRTHPWILANGGMAVPAPEREPREPEHFDPLGIDDDNHRGWSRSVK